jgi:hypothetical protein
MSNQVIKSSWNEEDDDLQHYGTRGMKWGVRKAASKTRSLERKVNKTVRKHDRGRNVDSAKLQKLSRKVRKQKSTIEKKVKRAQRFIAKAEKANAKDIINRYNKDPEKKQAVKEYMDTIKSNTAVLDELRMQLIDIRI